MSSRLRSFINLYRPIKVMAAIALIITPLYGCMGLPLLAMQVIPGALALAPAFLPTGTEAKLDNPGKGGTPEMAQAKRMAVLTNNPYAEEHLAGVFRTITYNQKAPTSTKNAATQARQNGYDAFLMVDTGGRVNLDGRIIHGKFAVKLVSDGGELLYSQTATLTSRANNTQSLSEREVSEALAKVIADDLSKSAVAVAKPVSTAATVKTADQVATAPTEPQQEKPSFLGKIKGLFD